MSRRLLSSSTRFNNGGLDAIDGQLEIWALTDPSDALVDGLTHDDQLQMNSLLQVATMDENSNDPGSTPSTAISLSTLLSKAARAAAEEPRRTFSFRTSRPLLNLRRCYSSAPASWALLVSPSAALSRSLVSNTSPRKGASTSSSITKRKTQSLLKAEVMPSGHSTV